MKYAIVNNGVFIREAPNVNTVWDSTHCCTPEHLTEDERLIFNVVPVVQTTKPGFDIITQEVVETIPTFDSMNWNQVWVVQALSAQMITENQAAQQYQADAAIIRVDPKLIALKTMTPIALKSWVAANVTNLSQAQDVIATLAIAIGILARRI